MSTSALFRVINGLVDGFTDILDGLATVSDGYSGGDVEGNFVMVGVEDPAGDSSQTATAEQNIATMGSARSRDEEGDVVCAAVAWRGDDDPRAARADLEAITARIETWLRHAPDAFAGLPQIVSIGYGSSVQLMTDPAGVDEDGNEYGLVVTLVFRVHFKARI